MGKAIHRGPLFEVADRFPGADEYTRRSLAQIDRGNPSTLKVVEACQRLRLKAQAPFWKTGAWAHIGIANLRVCIMVRGQYSTAFADEHRAKWAKHGFKALIVTEGKLERMGVEDVAAELSEALKALGVRT